ncbi:VOC family protein [Halobaculum sp. CBA1158]|uniref:VOC family protein n=1 Tax=Halobaculum sp. CBA1158 TaxID=2904243 RepID=UPI001F4245E8|nr:VOC family protein [Halobaculum sp. CBA1158]UIO98630.1 VOC family protein [Halobaculum sp. CBA1158]
MTPNSFFHVALKANDLDATAAFYADAFDGTIIERGSADDGEGATAVEHVALEVADKRVYVFDRAPYEATGDVEPMPTGVLHFGFVVDDVVAAREAIDADHPGVDWVMGPDRFGDLRIAFLLDPDGTIVELIEHVE